MMVPWEMARWLVGPVLSSFSPCRFQTKWGNATIFRQQKIRPKPGIMGMMGIIWACFFWMWRMDPEPPERSEGMNFDHFDRYFLEFSGDFQRLFGNFRNDKSPSTVTHRAMPQVHSPSSLGSFSSDSTVHVLGEALLRAREEGEHPRAGHVFSRSLDWSEFQPILTGAPNEPGAFLLSPW